MGCREGFVPVTTTQLGRAVRISQQAASAHLAELEAGGMIRRQPGGRGYPVHVTKRGQAELAQVAATLNAALRASPPRLTLRGEVVSGVGEGAYYMSLPGYVEQFLSKIGIRPFPGTLNVRLDAESARAILDIGGFASMLIDGFSDGKRTYGWVRCYPVLILPDIRCYMIRLERTHHDPCIMELISDVSLRQKAGLDNGSAVGVRMRPPDAE